MRLQVPKSVPYARAPLVKCAPPSSGALPLQCLPLVKWLMSTGQADHACAEPVDHNSKLSEHTGHIIVHVDILSDTEV